MTLNHGNRSMKLQVSVGGSRLGVLLLLIGLSGCRIVSTVRQVQENPRPNWFTSTVYLRGTVSDRAPLLDAHLYELQDRTGKIWVLSRAAPLQPGSQVLIKGQVRYQEIEIAGQNLGDVYIEEEQRLDPES